MERFFDRQKCHLSAFSFVNLYAWKDFFKFNFRIIDGNLCIFASYDLGYFLYLPPLGEKFSHCCINECFRIMESLNCNSRISRIENMTEDQLSHFDDKIFSFYQKSDEYLYKKEEIIHLKGNRFKSKRSSYNYFVKNYDFDFLPFQPNMYHDCLSLYDEWSQDRQEKCSDAIYRQMLKENRFVHDVVLREYETLGLTGRVVLVDGVIRGYTFGFKLNEEVFCILFEITDLKKKGLATYIFRKFCTDENLRTFRFINVMDDFGLPNIKRAKLSFRPSRIIPSYVVTKRTS